MKVLHLIPCIVVALVLSASGQTTIKELQILAKSSKAEERVIAAYGCRDFVVRDGHTAMLPIFAALLKDRDRDVVNEILTAITRTPVKSLKSESRQEVTRFFMDLKSIVLKLKRDDDKDFTWRVDKAVRRIDEAISRNE